MRRRLPLLRPLLLLGLVFVVTTTTLLLLPKIDRVVVAEGLLAGGSISVRAPQTGRIVELHVNLGDQPTKGDCVATLDSSAIEADLAQIKARIASLQDLRQSLILEKKTLVEVSYPEEASRSGRRVERARLQLASAESRFDAFEELFEKQLGTKLQVEDAKLAYDLAQLDLTEARQLIPRLEIDHRTQVRKLDAGARAAQLKLTEERARKDELDRLMGRSSIIIDTDGVVIGDRLDELIGQVVADGEELFRLAAGPAERFIGTLKDSARARVRAGLRVKIRLEGYPWIIHGTLLGVVDFVEDRRAGDGRGYQVLISFDRSSAPGPLYEGMKGQARIVVEEKVTLGRLLLEKLTSPSAN